MCMCVCMYVCMYVCVCLSRSLSLCVCAQLGQWLHHSQEQLQNLQNIVAQNVTTQNTTAQKHKRRLLNLGQLTLKIIKLSHTFRT